MPPAVFAVFGDHAPAAQVAGTAAAEAELPAAETTAARRRLDGHREHADHSQWTQVRSQDALPKMPEREQARTQDACRARMLSSMASQTSVAPPEPAVDMAVDRQGPEAGGEKARSEATKTEGEMQSWGTADSLQGQASSSSQQERSDSSRIMGLQTWTAEHEQEEQPGAEEMALERKKQVEAVCPLLLETGEVLAVPTLEDLTPAMLVYTTKTGAARPAGCGCRARKASAGA